MNCTLCGKATKDNASTFCTPIFTGIRFWDSIEGNGYIFRRCDGEDVQRASRDPEWTPGTIGGEWPEFRQCACAEIDGTGTHFLRLRSGELVLCPTHLIPHISQSRLPIHKHDHITLEPTPP